MSDITLREFVRDKRETEEALARELSRLLTDFVARTGQTPSGVNMRWQALRRPDGSVYFEGTATMEFKLGGDDA